MLAIDMKRRLARDRDLELRAVVSNCAMTRRGGDEMLEVVEQQQHRLTQPVHVFFQAFLW